MNTEDMDQSEIIEDLANTAGEYMEVNAALMQERESLRKQLMAAQDEARNLRGVVKTLWDNLPVSRERAAIKDLEDPAEFEALERCLGVKL